jgi:hypothetical protein
VLQFADIDQVAAPSIRVDLPMPRQDAGVCLTTDGGEVTETAKGYARLEDFKRAPIKLYGARIRNSWKMK